MIFCTVFKATPHKDCMRIAQSDFSADCTKATQEYSRISRSFRAIWRKVCKQGVCKAARRALCGVALIGYEYYRTAPRREMLGAVFTFVKRNATIWKDCLTFGASCCIISSSEVKASIN